MRETRGLWLGCFAWDRGLALVATMFLGKRARVDAHTPNACTSSPRSSA
ncbi:MAG: hypothetical protein KatS3mg122_1158 [Caldimonas sp.]|nr:MAG: hypothetical protein KatS3mg122_1158 [Caldimonas sp.]